MTDPTSALAGVGWIGVHARNAMPDLRHVSLCAQG
jgi:hypothetical protein